MILSVSCCNATVARCMSFYNAFNRQPRVASQVKRVVSHLLVMPSQVADCKTKDNASLLQLMLRQLMIIIIIIIFFFFFIKLFSL